jgi:hypothetical protein
MKKLTFIALMIALNSYLLFSQIDEKLKVG